MQMILSFGNLGAGGLTGGPVALALPALFAFVAYIVSSALPDRIIRHPRALLVTAWAVHAAALLIDMTGLAGTEPRFGFAPALSVTMWLVLAVYLVESRFFPIVGVRRALAGLGACAVVAAVLFPGEPLHTSLSPWSPLHWILGMASYGLFGVAVMHAALLNRADRQMRQKLAPLRSGGLPLMRLEHLTFRFVTAGFLVLSAALVLGWWFSNPWRWDHKTVLSVLGWAVFAALLAGRHTFGWRGTRATRWLYAGAALLLLAYAGSRFVIEVVVSRAGLV